MAPEKLIIGNLFSLVAAVFTCLSCISKSHRAVFFYQTLECLTLAIAQLIFFQISSSIMLLLGAMRNSTVSRGKYTRWVMLLFVVLTIVLGITLNTGGALGYIPILTTIIYTISTFYAKTFVSLRISILINLSLWLFYSVLILDISTALSSLFAICFCLYTLYKRLRLQVKLDKYFKIM